MNQYVYTRVCCCKKGQLVVLQIIFFFFAATCSVDGDGDADVFVGNEEGYVYSIETDVPAIQLFLHACGPLHRTLFSK